jgi:translation initiation factor 4E
MQQYETNLREIGTFGHVEDFWRYYHHIVKPTEMECNANCHFFKKEIKPMWEDDNNANGGKWVVVVGKQDRPALDAIWEGVLLSLIGETMGDSRELCGAVCSVRKKGDKIAVWTRNRNDEQSIMAIGQSFKKVLIVANAGHLKITYQFHEDALRSTTSYQNPVHFKL